MDIFEVSEDVSFYKISRNRVLDGEALEYETTYFDKRIVPFLDKDIVENSIYDYLEKKLHLKISHSRREIKFRYATEDEKKYIEWCKSWLIECKRILKNSGTLILYGSLGKRQITFARLAIMIEDEKIFLRQNWITQRNTRGIGSIKNYMSAREDILFLTKTNDYTFNIPYLDEKSKRKI